MGAGVQQRGARRSKTEQVPAVTHLRQVGAKQFVTTPGAARRMIVGMLGAYRATSTGAVFSVILVEPCSAIDRISPVKAGLISLEMGIAARPTTTSAALSLSPKPPHSRHARPTGAHSRSRPMMMCVLATGTEAFRPRAANDRKNGPARASGARGRKCGRDSLQE